MGVAVIAGASGGIGSAIAARLAADAMTVVVGFSNSAERAADVVAALPGTGHRSQQIDVTSGESIATAATAVQAAYGGIDVLVNCAGVTRPVPHDDLDALDDDLIDTIFATNWRGPFATIRAFRPLLSSAPDPVIVNISSVSGVTGQGSNVAYCASKAALDSMTRSLARSLGPAMRIVSVSPGWVLGEYSARMDQAMLDTQSQATPLGRLATADDVAAAVSAVVHHLPFTTGTTISVDGGRPLGTS